MTSVRELISRQTKGQNL